MWLDKPEGLITYQTLLQIFDDSEFNRAGREPAINSRVHRVYAVGLPVFVVCQTVVLYTILHNPPYWAKIANAILR